MDVIKLRIMGGLGNQLYQYAAARCVQEEFKCNNIIIDVGEYDNYIIRDLEINKLIQNDNVSFENKLGFSSKLVLFLFRVYQHFFVRFTKKHAVQKIFNIFGKSFMCSSVDFNMPNNIKNNELVMYGYFVSAKNSISIKNQLMNELVLHTEEITESYSKYLDLLQNKCTIAISIRCADDYVSNGWPVCTKEYYLKGIAKVLENIKTDNYQLIVFADDINKIKTEKWFEDFSNTTYIENISVCESFELLRNCSHYVCSNSSFSWWGAFLSYADKPVIINPNRIFAAGGKEDDQKTFYDSMILLDYITGELV